MYWWTKTKKDYVHFEHPFRVWFCFFHTAIIQVNTKQWNMTCMDFNTPCLLSICYMQCLLVNIISCGKQIYNCTESYDVRYCLHFLRIVYRRLWPYIWWSSGVSEYPTPGALSLKPGSLYFWWLLCDIRLRYIVTLPHNHI